MTDEAAPLDTGPSPATDTAQSAPEAVSTPAPTVAESLAATFDRIQEREGNAPGQRGADGKFKNRAAPGEVPAPASGGTNSQTTDQPEVAAPGTATPSIEAPASWSADAKAKWSALPPDLQAVIAKRESEAHERITTDGQRLKAFDGLSQVLEPRRQELMASYGSVEKGVSDLLALHARYHTDPVSVIVGLAQGAGIRLDQLPQLAAQPQTRAPVDPQIAALSQTVESLKSHITSQSLSESQKIVDAFKADPKHKHYAAVEPRIAELINAGAARDLPSAYKLAVRERDDLLEQEFADRAAAAKAKADAEARELATKARSANVVNIRTPGGRAATAAKPASVRETLLKAYDKASGAA